MKRLVLLITAMLLLAMLAVACGGGETETPVEEAAPTEEAAPVEEEASGDVDCAAEDVLCIGLVTDCLLYTSRCV